MQAAHEADIRPLFQRGGGIEDELAVGSVARMLEEHVYDERHPGLGGALEHPGKVGQEAFVVEVGVAVRPGEGQAEALRERSFRLLLGHI